MKSSIINNLSFDTVNLQTILQTILFYKLNKTFQELKNTEISDDSNKEGKGLMRISAIIGAQIVNK